MRAAATTIATMPRVGQPTSGHTGAVIRRVAGSIKTTLTLLEDQGRRICIVATHLGTSGDDSSYTIQRALSRELTIEPADVLVFSSHNHSVPLIEKHTLTGYLDKLPSSDLTDLGKAFVRELRSAARKLAGKLEPVTIWYAQGREGRITYNRKGRRPDGSAYLIREEDRALLGRDYRGDIDEQAPLVCLRRDDGSPLAFLVQFNGHPATVYHPEHMTACGDWPQFACDRLAHRFNGRGEPELPVSFLQGCAGEINSKHMFSGDLALAKRFGRYLGEAYIEAARKLRPSRRDGFDFIVEKAKVPLARVPSARELRRELEEMEDFVRRAREGDQNTLTCVGLNFPRAMTPAYRGKLVEYIIPWNRWALKLRESGKASSTPKHIGIDVHVLRLGDVGIVGIASEPFQGIGRQIRRASPLPLTIPCGYCNEATGYVGYVPDSPNVGDREYMSAFHRYTRFLPPFRRPAGDVLARVAIRHLEHFARST